MFVHCLVLKNEKFEKDSGKSVRQAESSGFRSQVNKRFDEVSHSVVIYLPGSVTT